MIGENRDAIKGIKKVGRWNALTFNYYVKGIGYYKSEIVNSKGMVTIQDKFKNILRSEL